MAIKSKKPKLVHQLDELESGLETITADLSKLELDSKIDLEVKYSQMLDIGKRLSQLHNQADELSSSISKQNLYASIFITLTALLVIFFELYIPSMHLGDNISINYYITVVQLIPVLLIALYFSGSRSKSISNRQDAVAELIGNILPSFIGIVACLISIANNKSYELTFMLTIYALYTISLFSIFEMVGTGLSRKDRISKKH